MNPRPGLRLTDRLRLSAKLAEGGMGSVWIAEHETLGTQVAVKLIGARARSPELRARFSREAQAAARIKSPHVVQIHDHGVYDDDAPFIVMELLDGDTLRDRIHRDGRLRLAEVVPIVNQVAAALTAAHEQDVVHRDIKPENVALVQSSPPFVKVLDFGLAKLRDGTQLTAQGARLGTPLYMSPEQLMGQPVDPRSDLWSLGVMAYECLAGTPPFEAQDMSSFTASVTTGTYPPLSRRRPELPPELDGWFARALSPDPAQRFSSATKMADALNDLMHRLSVSPTQVDAQAPTLVDSSGPAPVPAASPDRMAPVVAVEARSTSASARMRHLGLGLMAGLVIAMVAWWAASSDGAPRSTETKENPEARKGRRDAEREAQKTETQKTETQTTERENGSRKLTVNCVPSCTVRVDGKEVGVSPVVVDLSSRRHEIEVRAGDETRRFDVPAGDESFTRAFRF